MVQFGTGTGSDYGTGVLDTIATLTAGDIITRDFLHDVQTAVVAIQTVLAAVPEGLFASVQARIADAESRLTTLETPGPTSALVETITTTPVSASAGVAFLTATAAFPANTEAVFAVGKVTTAFGTSNGLTGIALGDASLGFDIWTPSMGIILNAESNVGQQKIPDRVYNAVARDVRITALGGPFDATGGITITTYALSLTPQT